VIGSAIGGFVAYKLAYKKAADKYNEIATNDIAEMRQHYNEKVVALDLSQKKGDLNDLVRDKGYSAEVAPPMAVTPPQAVVDAAKEAAEEEDIPESEEEEGQSTHPEIINVFRDEVVINDEWDWYKERKKRSPRKPYIIHVDERSDHDAYDDVTFTYFEGDDVLCNERDEVVSMEDRERLLGETNITQFGHGSHDASIVYIRNDQLEIDFEVVWSGGAYAEEVHGFNPSEPEIKHSYRRRGFDDE
ncbi:MAG TPA: hypothetical protein VN843_21700, partial [Anaerolineales bacterium]|nr:hypothetical protein [Anaerolineales bacterium]